jgi:serine phosphatase RsbU (regulator of sigma subunit)
MEKPIVNIRNGKRIAFLKQELENFQDMATKIKPLSGDLPEVKGMDIYGEVVPYNGVIGGDHIVYVDFNKRYDLDHRIGEARIFCPEIVSKLELNKQRAGVLLADVSGHHITDALLSAMLHQAFLTGVQYELQHHGEVTSRLFEILNTRFFNSSSLSKFITMIYGEISESGEFKFVNAGHPPPVVFSSRYDKLMQIGSQNVAHFPPIGTLPSSEDIDCKRNFSRLGYKKKYSINRLSLMGSGDILLIYTDGLSEHWDASETPYFPDKLEEKLRSIKTESAQDIFQHIKEDLLNFGKPLDDISFVVIKKLES